MSVKFDKVIPAGSKYIMACGIILKEGESFPQPKNKDTFCYKDYNYTYIENLNGWQVNVVDKNKKYYDEILESINDINIVSMFRTFWNCTELIKSPKIPNTVTNIRETFYYCKSLSSAPIIPNGVTNMIDTFNNCTSLAKAPTIPTTVTELIRTFEICTSLTEAPEIPDKITNLEGAFQRCVSLTTISKIPDSVNNMYASFCGCKSLVSIPAIPEEVKDLSYTFYGCDSLRTVIFKNPNTNINKTFSQDAKLRLKGLSESIIKEVKSYYPNIKFEEKSNLFKFLEKNIDNNLPEI